MSKISSQSGIRVIGVMSGTSLDGLDLCSARFWFEDDRWRYMIEAAESESYSADIKKKLAAAQLMDAQSYARFNSDYGIYLGRVIKSFIVRNSLKPHLIASHGHTIFHQPSIRFTAQIGSGAGIAAETGLDTVCDFRTTDVALYGQGAPLVPIGDRHLFGDYDYCLNLGGFSNISYEENSLRIAFDISPVNYILNHYMREEGKDFDEDGERARSGRPCEELIDRLNHLAFYSQSGPKSLSRENVEEEFIPLIDSYYLSLEDRLSTLCEHISIQISRNIKGGKVLVTGGGAFNKYLIERLEANSKQCTYQFPDKETIKFKEALIFAFLGALYYYDLPNCLSSVTGARYDSIGGALYKGFPDH